MKMNILIYGAGKNGCLALDLIKEEYRVDCNIIGFIDSFKSGSYQGYPIFKLDDIADLSATIVIAIGDFEVAKEVCLLLKKRGFLNIFWFARKMLALKRADFFVEQCTDCQYWTGSILKQIEMHIMDACNLNCKGCSHFSPIFPDTLPKLQERLSDVKKLKEKFTHIARFYILGGEPFLNPEINEYIRGIRLILPNTELYIVTNGLLIPRLDDETFQCINENNVIISISEYQPTHRIINCICDKLNAFEIRYDIRKLEKKQKFCIPLSLKENSKYPNICISDGCVTIWNGKIARCPTLMYISYFNSYFHTALPEEGIISLDDDISGEVLLKKLKGDVPLCRHCVNNETDWAVCGKNASLEDFATFE